MNKKICVICGRQYKGFGHNPAPVEYDGRCCDECDARVVIPARLKILNKKKR